MTFEHQINCDCYDCRKSLPPANYAKDFKVEWDTTPKLANPLLFWKDWWSAKTWIEWHKKVKAKYGKKRANEVLIIWFERSPFASPTIDFRTFDEPFIKYAKQEGFYDGLFSGLGGLVGRSATVVKKSADTAGNILDTGGNLIAFVGKHLNKILLVAVIIIIIGALSKAKNLWQNS